MGLISCTSRGFVNIVDSNSFEILFECAKIETELQIAFQKCCKILLHLAGLFMVNSNKKIIQEAENPFRQRKNHIQINEDGFSCWDHVNRLVIIFLSHSTKRVYKGKN